MTDLTSAKPRIYDASYPTVDIDVILGGTVYEGMALELTNGTATAVNGAGVFAGFAMMNGVSGETIKARVQCKVLLTITTDTTAQTDVGNLQIEATDSDTFRIETGGAIVGTSIGYVCQSHTIAAGGKCWVAARATQLVT